MAAGVKTIIIKDGDNVFEYTCDPSTWDEDQKKFIERWNNPLWEEKSGERLPESVLLRNIQGWMRSE